MIPITQDFIHINQFSRTGKKLRDRKGIVMHYTASPGAPARNISRYFDNLRLQDPKDIKSDTYAGAHLSVDRFTKIQSIPTDEVGYHCGSATYTQEALVLLGAYPNDSTVGIEMCIELDGSIHEDTFQNAADLVVWLITVEKFPNVIFTHKGVVGWKDCPLPWVKNPSELERFKALVNKKLSEVDYVIKVEDANAIVRVLSAAYATAATKKEKDEIHRLANEVRKASNQATA